ncbi:phage tail family protein [Bacillus niameyensis]|uniref:hypothetical protein n=1 Tax=Bacillus niameyensis TaxID=1522308 RepID=UPI00078573CD|nr:hypothetical protein [Bacillus niameyensis]
MFTGIEFNGKHSYKDFGLTISDREIGNPSKIKNTERVPYSDIVYDFSEIYGGQEYSERILKYTFEIAYRDKSKDYYFYETEVINWLMSTNQKGMLKDDLIPGYYFLAEIEDGPSSNFKWVGGSLQVEFTAYPFKISELDEGNDIWDEFNFLLDYAQKTKFKVNGTLHVTLYNPGTRTAKPVIKATEPMTMLMGNKTFNIPAGESQSYDFLLREPKNKITITGNGEISFHFRKELI